MSLFGYLTEKFDDLLDETEKVSDEATATIEKRLGDIHEHIDDFLQEVKQGLIDNPEPVFALLRRFKPILLVKDYALITRFDDVQEVLSRDGVFQQVYGKKMAEVNHGMNYILGMGNTPTYTRDKSNIWQAMPRQDIPDRVLPLIEKTAGDIVARSHGELDVVLDLFQGVQLQLMTDYFGILVPDRKAFFESLFDLSRYIFGDFGDDPKNRELGLRAGKIYNQILLDSIAAAKTNQSALTIVGRFLKMQRDGVPGNDDESIRSNLFGTIMGAIPAPSVSFSCAVDFLIDRPDDLQSLHHAALMNDGKAILRFIYEGYRFKPMTPGWFRVTAEDYILGKDTARATTIPKGTTTIALTQSAMMDANIIDEPHVVRLDRPDYHYMVYAYGIHECMGKYVSDPMMAFSLRALMQQKNVRRVPGAAGKTHIQSGFPNGFRVCFDI